MPHDLNEVNVYLSTQKVNQLVLINKVKSYVIYYIVYNKQIILRSNEMQHREIKTFIFILSYSEAYQ